MDCSPPGSSVHSIFQARTLEWVAISSSRDSSLRRDLTDVSCVFCRAGGSLPAEPPGKPPSYTLLLLFSGPVMSDSVRPLRWQPTRLPCPGTAAYQAPPSMGFSSQEYWSGVPLPSPSLCYSTSDIIIADIY